MLISVLLRMQKEDYVKVNIIALKLQTQKILISHQTNAIFPFNYKKNNYMFSIL